MNLDNIVISPTQPKQTNSVWINTSDSEHLGVSVYVNGKWTNALSGITDMHTHDITQSGETTQTFHFHKGDNWIGTYLSLSMNDFNQAPFVDGTILKGYDRATYFFEGYGFLGTLDEIEESQMYVLVTPQDVDVTFTGTPIHSDIDIPLRKGWNYINYPFEYEMNIEDALHDFNPQVGDKIQDEQKRESTFTILRKGGKWDGPVQILEPGKGYKYYSMEPKTVHYHQHADLKVVKSIAVDGHDMYVSMVGVDQEPVEGSRNLITSGAVYAALNPGQ